jgi:hypothetical protein
MVTFPTMDEASATAEGELARTPLAHLLVYALDRRLTGALFLAPPSREEHVIRLCRGVPTKVRPGDGFSPLGEMLVEAGAIDLKTMEAALATKGLLGDVLLLAGRVERDLLEKVAEEQFRRRMVRLFALPPETTYRYYDGHQALAEYGGDPAGVDPLALLWAGIRVHGDVSVMMDTTLARLGEAPLRLSPAATVARFGLDAEEAKLCEALAARTVTLAELCAVSFPGLARRFVYALVITRQIDIGMGLSPLDADLVAPSSSPDAPGGSPAEVRRAAGASPVPPRAPVDARAAAGAAVGRMTLRSTVHRMGAAAPDAPGAGERGSPVVVSRRPKDRSGSPDEPPSSRPEALPPVEPVPESGVVAVPSKPVAHAEPMEHSVIAFIAARRESSPDVQQVEAGEEDLAAVLSALDEDLALAPLSLLDPGDGGQEQEQGDTAGGAAPPVDAVAVAEAPRPSAAAPAEVESAESEPSAPPAVDEPLAPPPAAAQPEAPPVAGEQPEAPPAAGEQPEAPPAAGEQPEVPPAAGEQSEVPPVVAEQREAAPVAADPIAGQPAVAVEEDPAEKANAPGREAVVGSDAFAAFSPSEIFWLARECLAERDLEGALEACEAGTRAVPGDPDLTALGVWARAQLGGADIKALTVLLDDVLLEHEDHVEARFYRGMLRKRLGDEAGSLHDLHQVLERSPEHEGASVALAAGEQRQKRKSERPSLFGKLFKR